MCVIVFLLCFHSSVFSSTISPHHYGTPFTIQPIKLWEQKYAQYTGKVMIEIIIIRSQLSNIWKYNNERFHQWSSQLIYSFFFFIPVFLSSLWKYIALYMMHQMNECVHISVINLIQLYFYTPALQSTVTNTLQKIWNLENARPEPQKKLEIEEKTPEWKEVNTWTVAWKTSPVGRNPSN